jgi:23S rRNA (pseudouridine1915-N3)-methyltransferase
MAQIKICAIGKLKNDSLHELQEDYRKRMKSIIDLKEWESRRKDEALSRQQENEWLQSTISAHDFVIALDERGKNIKSIDLAQQLERQRLEGKTPLFLIGGANGLTDQTRAEADFLLSFGQLTWPHKLARIMLLEQIYRSLKILENHPYHREG